MKYYLVRSRYASCVLHYALNYYHSHHFGCSIIKIIHNSRIIWKFQCSNNVAIFFQGSTKKCNNLLCCPAIFKFCLAWKFLDACTLYNEKYNMSFESSIGMGSLINLHLLWVLRRKYEWLGGGRGLGARRERALDAVLTAGGETAGTWCAGASRQGERDKLYLWPISSLLGWWFLYKIS